MWKPRRAKPSGATRFAALSREAAPRDCGGSPAWDRTPTARDTPELRRGTLAGTTAGVGTAPDGARQDTGATSVAYRARHRMAVAFRPPPEPISPPGAGQRSGPSAAARPRHLGVSPGGRPRVYREPPVLPHGRRPRRWVLPGAAGGQLQGLVGLHRECPPIRKGSARSPRRQR